MTQTLAILLTGILLLPLQLMWAQKAFECGGDFYLVHNDSNGAHFYSSQTDPSNVNLESLFTINTYNSIDAIGFRITDNLIYGVDTQSSKLLKIGSDGVAEELTVLSGAPMHAGDVSPDGRYLVLVSNDLSLMVKIDLNSSSYDAEFLPITPINSSAPLQCSDVAFLPNTNELYAYDELTGRLVTINIDNGILNNIFYPVTSYTKQVPALFFDWQRNLFGISRAFGSSASYFSQFSLQGNDVMELDMTNGFDGYLDGCSCPFGVRLEKAVFPEAILPCEDAYYTFIITNYTGENTGEFVLRDNLPPGIDFKSVIYNGLDVEPVISLGNQVILSDFRLPEKIDSLVIQVESDALTTGYFPNQAIIESSSQAFSTLSDNPLTINHQDPTFIELLAAEEDMDLCAEKEKKVYAPSAFSPNGDNVNDIFFLQTANQISFENFEIYNRWGNLAWSIDSGKTNDPIYGWDGISPKDNYLPNGVYAWKAKLIFLDGFSFTYSGSVLLSR